MKYLYVFLASLKAKLIYRTNIVLEYGLTILQVGVSIFVWEALYSQKALVVPNYSLEKLNVYLFLANFLALSFSVAPTFRLATQIKSGRLSTLLERPISLYGEHLAYFIGDKFLGIVINLCLVVYFGALSGISVLMLLLLVIYLAFAGVNVPGFKFGLQTVVFFEQRFQFVPRRLRHLLLQGADAAVEFHDVFFDFQKFFIYAFF